MFYAYLAMRWQEAARAVGVHIATRSPVDNGDII